VGAVDRYEGVGGDSIRAALGWLRPGEALGLTVDRVEFLRRSIRVGRQLITIAGSPLRLGPAKTPSSVRNIPIPQLVVDQLALHLEQFGVGATGLIFTDTKGDPIRRNAFRHIWRRAATKAGVNGFKPHALRHYAATVMIDQGASVKAVQRHLGSSSATTTLDTYAHLWPDSEDITRRALDAGSAAVVSFSCHDTAAEGRREPTSWTFPSIPDHWASWAGIGAIGWGRAGSDTPALPPMTGSRA